MLSDNTDISLDILNKFGLSREESLVYLNLLRSSSTALSLSRDLKIARTKIYRLLEKLIQKGLVIEEIKDYGTKFIAESYEKLNLIIDQKDRELEELKLNAPMLFNQLAAVKSQMSSQSKILHYRGMEGLKQVTWNSTKVRGDFRIYEVSLLHDAVDQDFAEKARREFAKQPKNRFMQLTNSIGFDGYSNVAEHIKQWSVRHVPKKDLDIKFEIQIYNDVYCMFQYTSDDIFIVEIYNQNLADMQKQIFDFVWKHATPMKKIDDRGGARLE